MAKNPEVERIAETHFFIRPTLLQALERVQLTQEGSAMFSVPVSNYRELWERTYTDKWFDMATLVRLGTAIETGLRDCHGRTSSRKQGDTSIFQRLANPDKLLALFDQDCKIELGETPGWNTMREVMIHRHLYAHRNGLVDSKYLKDLGKVDDETRKQVRQSGVGDGHPIEGEYWFEPLTRLAEFINSARRFFAALP